MIFLSILVGRWITIAICVATNPSNYLYFYDWDYQIVRASPKSGVCQKGQVTTNPIAGDPGRVEIGERIKLWQRSCFVLNPRRSGGTPYVKIDLGRNDIGKIAQNKSVEITKYMEVEYFRYVMHLTQCGPWSASTSTDNMDALKSNPASWYRLRRA